MKIERIYRSMNLRYINFKQINLRRKEERKEKRGIKTDDENRKKIK